MPNPNAKLNPKIFEKDVKQLPTRDGFGEGVVRAGEGSERVVVLCADVSESTRADAFKRAFPDRFFEVGVAEQNMAAIAAGMGISGKCPYITSYATFSPGRNWDQIRTTICYNNSNVKIVGSHAGLSVGPDGATHQALEDIALMRVLPNMKVIVPCDAIEARKAILAVSLAEGPAYVRLGREKTPVVTTDETPFQIGRAEVLWERQNPRALIIGCGPVLYQALCAAKKLEEEGVGSVVLNVHTVKPLDNATILRYARNVKKIVTVEEHQIVGGLGSAVAELLAEECPVEMSRIGVRDSFGQSGKPNELLEHFGITEDAIVNAAKDV